MAMSVVSVYLGCFLQILSYALCVIKRMHTTGTMIEQSCHVGNSNITLSGCNSRKRREGQVQDANELLCLGTMRLEQSRIVHNTPGHRPNINKDVAYSGGAFPCNKGT